MITLVLFAISVKCDISMLMLSEFPIDIQQNRTYDVRNYRVH
jgi:hypothetical protein